MNLHDPMPDADERYFAVCCGDLTSNSGISEQMASTPRFHNASISVGRSSCQQTIPRLASRTRRIQSGVSNLCGSAARFSQHGCTKSALIDCASSTGSTCVELNRIEVRALGL